MVSLPVINGRIVAANLKWRSKYGYSPLLYLSPIYFLFLYYNSSTLLAQRPIDGSRAGFNSWPFMTVHNWGENPDGVWKLEVHNEGRFYGE